MSPAQRVRNDWRALMEKLSYKAIVTNIPFLGFLAMLCVFYITNSRRATEMQREMTNQTKTLKELKWKYLDVQSQLMHAKTETKIIKTAEDMGLKPSLIPAYKVQK